VRLLISLFSFANACSHNASEGFGMLLLTTDRNREVILFVFVPTPRIEGSCE